jgi:hypothetical protein
LPEKIQSYEILERIGSGGITIVWKARHGSGGMAIVWNARHEFSIKVLA